MIYGAGELAEGFRTVRKNTITIAEEIPEDKYSFKATPDVKSVGEMLAHIAVSPAWHIEVHGQHVASIDFAFFGSRMAKSAAAEAALAGKDQIVKALKEQGEQFAAFIEGLTPQTLEERVSFPAAVGVSERSRFEMLLSVKEHEMHHRAQLMLIQRVIGIVPHVTRKRQAMMAEAQARV